MKTNIIGTVNLLQASKDLKSLKALVNITTDKCYDNKEWCWSYRENDELGGHDPYSASKACSELITNSYKKSFFEKLNIGLASARAGNVIGGGDFSKDRIIPDIVRSIKNNQKVIIRNPNAVRPWQHVLDVYKVSFACKKLIKSKIFRKLQFGPLENKEIIVEEITKEFIYSIGKGSYAIDSSKANLHETTILRLILVKLSKNLIGFLNLRQSKQLKNAWYKEYC